MPRETHTDSFHVEHIDSGYAIDSRCDTCFPHGRTEAQYQTALAAHPGNMVTVSPWVQRATGTMRTADGSTPRLPAKEYGR